MILNNSRNDADDGLWLTAYADLISAILAVVVLMLTFAPVDMEELMEAVTENTQSNVEPLDSLMQRLESVARELAVRDQVKFENESRGLLISLGTVSLFEPNSHDLDRASAARFIPLLQEIAGAAAYRHVDVEGHSDDTGSVADKWHVSMLRTAAMRRYLELLGFPDQGLRLVALGDTMPQVRPKGLTGEKLEQARRENRRIVIRVHRRKSADAD